MAAQLRCDHSHERLDFGERRQIGQRPLYLVEHTAEERMFYRQNVRDLHRSSYNTAQKYQWRRSSVARRQANASTFGGNLVGRRLGAEPDSPHTIGGAAKIVDARPKISPLMVVPTTRRPKKDGVDDTSKLHNETKC